MKKVKECCWICEYLSPQAWIHLGEGTAEIYFDCKLVSNVAIHLGNVKRTCACDGRYFRIHRSLRVEEDSDAERGEKR